MNRLLAAAVATLLALAPAQDRYTELRDRLLSVFHGSNRAEQSRALLALVECGDPRGPDQLQLVLTEFRKSVDELRQRAEQLDLALAAARREVAKAGPAGSPGRDKADQRVRELRAEVTQASVGLSGSLGMEDEIRASVGRAIGRLGDAQRNSQTGRVIIAIQAAPTADRKRELLGIIARIGTLDAWNLVRSVLASGTDPRLRADAARYLGEAPDGAHVSSLARALGDEFFVVRTAAVAALRLHHEREAVDALIAAIPRETGRLQGEIIDALGALTGRNFHDNEPLWRDWWKQNRGQWSGPAAGGTVVEASGGGRVSFYGIETSSTRICFVIDASSSMTEKVVVKVKTGQSSGGPPDETKLDRAKRELCQVLDGLPIGATFNIVVFSDTVRPYSPTAIQLSDAARKDAQSFVRNLTARGQTNILDALDQVFGVPAPGTTKSKQPVIDTVFFLSDGSATAGRLTHGGAIADEVARRNRDHHLTIKTVGIGATHDVTLMRRLAQESGGKYVSIGRDK